MYLNRASQLIEALKNLDKLKPEVKKGFGLIKEQSKAGTIYTCGNGGSSSAASHLTEELVGKYDKIRPPIKSICFSSNPDLITCISNDFKYKNVFARQVECFCSSNDVLIIFTTSGNSKNLVYTIEAALLKKVPIVVFSGKTGGLLGKFKDKTTQIIINSENGAIIQELHLHLIHSLVEFIEKD